MAIQPLEAAELESARQAAQAEALLAAEAFGSALHSSPTFVRLRTAGAALAGDEAAQQAVSAFMARQQEFRLELSFGTITAEQRADLERLQSAMLAIPTVAEYVAAQQAFEEICRETAGIISGEIGIDFAANCRAGGCCGG